MTIPQSVRASTRFPAQIAAGYVISRVEMKDPRRGTMNEIERKDDCPGRSIDGHRQGSPGPGEQPVTEDR